MMPFTQPDLCSESHTSNTFLSFNDQDLCSKINSSDPLEVPSCDHWQFCEKVTLRSDVGADSLGSPNATLDNPCSCPPKQEEEASARNIVTYLKAFALIYVLPEVDWTAEKIGMLLSEGTRLFPASSENDQPEDDNQGENKILQSEINTDEKRIVRKFNLEGHAFTLALEPRYFGKATRQHTIRNLRRMLQSFFKASPYCLLLTRVGNLLVWQRSQVFFVLKVQGRGRNTAVTMLVCLKTIDDVVHLASNLSGMTAKDEFTIRELVVVRLETPDGRIYMRDSSTRSVEIKAVNKRYAYLKATLHLPLNQSGPVKYRSGLMVAVGSILAGKVHCPSNWDTNTLDRLMCYGVELCRSYWTDCLRDRRPIDLDTFPTQLRLGQFVLELKLIPYVKTGHWECGICIIGTDFEAHVREVFKEYSNVVFQINNQMYAMWARDDFYYLLDPYRHSVVGPHLAEDQGEGAKWATVRMFRDQLTLLSVFHQLLKESNGQSAYYLHVVHIRNLAECPKGFALAPLPEDVDALDVVSLNEPIMFGDQPGVSEWNKFLQEISDYEDEEKLRILKERQNAGGMVPKALPTTTRRPSKKKLPKTCISKTRSSTNAAPRKPEAQTLTKKEKKFFKNFQASMKSASVLQEESKKMQKKSSPRRVKSKHVKLTKNPHISVVSTLFSRQTGGTVSDPALCPGRAPNVKWSAKESSLIKLGNNLRMRRDASLKASELRILPCEGHSTLEYRPTKHSDTISLQTAVRDIPQQSMEKSSVPEVVAVATTNITTPAAAEISSTGSCSAVVEEPTDRNESLPRFPGFSREPQLLAVVGSESGTVESLNRVLGSAFKVANRVLTLTPWGNYIIFRHHPNCNTESAASWFYLFDGCTCDIDRFRHLDLSRGTAGLVAFRSLSQVVRHLVDLREGKALKMLRTRVKEGERHHKERPKHSAQ